MNNSALLHIVERLEGFLGKLPDSIRRPVLNELTPLKELFLQQRPPRFVLTGSDPMPLLEFVARVFGEEESEIPSCDTLTGLYRWQRITLGAPGSIEFLDARGADEATLALVREQFRDQAPDLFFFLPAERAAKAATDREMQALQTMVGWVRNDGRVPAVIEVRPEGVEMPSLLERASEAPTLQSALRGYYSLGRGLRTILATHLPNEARVELVRSGGDRHAQAEIAELLVKSTSAICAAIGAQPIPLADLPVLTTLQLVMVSGIMYISGRERSLRAATEFLGAIGANVGLGMILREGARFALKFMPGWGNVVCGMVAGAGTFAIGRAATVYFIEGATLREARHAFTRHSTRSIPASGKTSKALPEPTSKP